MRPLRVVLADGGRLSRRDLLDLADRAGFDVVGEAPGWASVGELVESKSADLILIAGDPDYARGALPNTCPAIVIAPDPIAAKEYVESGAYAVLVSDCDAEVLSAMGQLAVARAADLADARKQTDQLRGQLETRKLVERAKGLLMKRLEITEDVAYRKMQKASQDENRRLRDIADSILAAERLYDEGTQDEPA